MSWAVKVPRTKLLEILKKNKETHRGDFKEALAGYKRVMHDAIDEFVKRLENDPHKAVRLIRGHAIPTDHTNEYEAVIGMLELSDQEYVTLGVNEYQNFVQDEWSWSHMFKESVSNYSNYRK